MYCNMGFHTDRSLGKSFIQMKDLKKLSFDGPISICDNSNIGALVELLKLNKLNIPSVELYIIESYEEKRAPREIIRFFCFDSESYKSMCAMINIATQHKHYAPRLEINDLILNGDFVIIVNQDFLFLDKLPKDKTYIAINSDTNLSDSNLFKYNTIFYYDSYALTQQDLKKIEILSARSFKHDKQVWYYDDSHYKIASFFPESIENYKKIISKVTKPIVEFIDRYPIFCKDDENLFDALVDCGFKKKCPSTIEYKDRLEYERSIIKKMKYCSYFLINWDIINWCRINNIPIGPGRGSAAGCLIAYCLDIVKLDPIRNNLYFERFLNPERVSPPDIDTDVAKDDRQLVIEYIKEKYGSEKVSQIITYNTIKSKMALKDSCRLNGVEADEANRITSYWPPSKFGVSCSLEEAKAIEIIGDWANQHNKVWDDAKVLESFIRHTGIHAAGIVIAPEPLNNITGLSYTDKNECLCQLDKFTIETFGLLKLDLLGLETLGLIKNTQALLEKSYYDLETIPTNDLKVLQAFAAGDTHGIFQFESDGMKKLLRRVIPTDFEDLSAINALYRPGPLTAGLTDLYVKNKHSINQEECLFEEFKKLMPETYSVMVYQEQIMLISQKLAGFSLSRADNLRKAIGKKDHKLMATMQVEFIQGCVKNGHQSIKAEKLWNQIVGFADYCFNKAHSAAYSLLAYWTMYLKVYYPNHFAVSLLSSHVNDSTKIRQDFFALKSKVKFLSPEINKAKDTFTLCEDGVRIGFSALKGLGNSAKTIIENQPYTNIVDVVLKNKLDSAQFTSLIYAGSFDEFETNKGILLGNVERLLKYAKSNNSSEIFNIF